jgi:two-component sensor histidine kinase
LGIALTTSTLLGDEAKQFAADAASGQLKRSALERFVARTREGTGLLYSNLTRAADLVHSFKQVAADQTSGERRQFEMAGWLQDLLTSLSPVLRKTALEVAIDCPSGIQMDTYPGALGQVLTNLLTNAVAHAYDDGQAGRLAIRVSEPRSDSVRIVFSDDGRGIPPANIGKVFDPFFTTGRSKGSTGLGLHIVYNLVTGILQGRLDLYSKVGKGTRFTIDLPKTLPHTQSEQARNAGCCFKEPDDELAQGRCLGRNVFACRKPRKRKDAGLLLRGKPGIAEPADHDNYDGHQCGAAVLQQPCRVRSGNYRNCSGPGAILDNLA